MNWRRAGRRALRGSPTSEPTTSPKAGTIVQYQPPVSPDMAVLAPKEMPSMAEPS